MSELILNLTLEDLKKNALREHVEDKTNFLTSTSSHHLKSHDHGEHWFRPFLLRNLNADEQAFHD